MINIDVNELKFFFNKKYRDAFIDNIVNQRDDLKKELEEAKKLSIVIKKQICNF